MQSDNIKKLTGEFNKPRLMNNPKAKGQATMPKGLPKEAQAFWKKYIPLLQSMGLASKIDEPLLIELARTYGQLQQAIIHYEKAEPGTIQQTRLYNIMATSRQSLCKQAKAFGLTPLDRNALSVDLENENDTEKFFFQ